MITVLFFAQLKERLDCGQLEIEVSESLTVSDLISQLAEQGEKWQYALQQGQVLAAVNQTMATPATIIQPNDEVALFPPVTGG